MKKTLITKKQKQTFAPSIGFISLGCPKALVDSEKIITNLKIRGYIVANSYQEVDLVVVNTCGFIQSAIEESLLAIAEALAENGSVLVCGCLGKFPEKIVEQFPQIKAITGSEPKDVIKAVCQLLPLAEGFSPPQFYQNDYRVMLTPPQYSYLKIAEGCNHKCRFCIIPQMRGKLRSEKTEDLVQEAKIIASKGCQEILLIAQDLLAYGNDFRNSKNLSKNLTNKSSKYPIIELVDKLSEIGVWLRLHYIYPYPFVEEIIEMMGNVNKKILPYLDIPLQHISAPVLHSMRRPAINPQQKLDKNHSEKMLERIAAWRNKVPELVIRSTFIVGYPGESENDFEELLSFIAQANLDRVGCFTYSAVAGACANDLPEQIPEKIKEERKARLMKVQEKISRQKLKKRVGKNYEVIIQNKVKISDEEYFIARSYAEAPDIDGAIIINAKNLYSKIVDFPKDINLQRGEHLEVKIIKSDSHDLIAEAIKPLPRFVVAKDSQTQKHKIANIPIIQN